MTIIATVALDRPIIRGDTAIAQLQLRKPGPGELRGLSIRDVALADADAMLTLLPRIAMPPLTDVEVAGMDLSDFVECCNQVAGFLPQTGRSTASPTE